MTEAESLLKPFRQHYPRVGVSKWLWQQNLTLQEHTRLCFPSKNGRKNPEGGRKDGSRAFIHTAKRQRNTHLFTLKYSIGQNIFNIPARVFFKNE